LTEGTVPHAAAPAAAAQLQPLSDLFPVLYPLLRQRARRCIAGEAPGHTLQATALVHEAYLRLSGGRTQYVDTNHLLAVVTVVMRQVLIDHARARGATKRAGRLQRVPLDDACRLADRDDTLLFEVVQVLDRFKGVDPLRARMFELDFLLGLSHVEIAEALAVEPGRVKYGLGVARAWLRQALAEPLAAAE
jgi:RNA polymerase sigma factor (TIGR02999 family)